MATPTKFNKLFYCYLLRIICFLIHRFASPAQSAPKTFYFGMNETLSSGPRNEIDQREEEARLKLRDREDGRSSVNTVDDAEDNVREISYLYRSISK